MSRAPDDFVFHLGSVLLSLEAGIDPDPEETQKSFDYLSENIQSFDAPELPDAPNAARGVLNVNLKSGTAYRITIERRAS